MMNFAQTIPTAAKKPNVDRQVRVAYRSSGWYAWIGAALIGVLMFANQLHAQTVIRGRITDLKSGEAIGYANISLVSQPTVGTTTDFEGFYELKTNKGGIDSLRVSQMGYEMQVIPIQEGKKQKLNVRLKPTTYTMEEVVVSPGKPAYLKILEKVWAQKPNNDRRSLKAYEYESYARTELSVTNMSEKFKNRGFMKPFKPIFDSMQVGAGQDGEDVLPVFVSETLSQMYHRNDPKAQREVIKASDVTGVGLEDGSFISQFVGASFQQYNFYHNWLTIINKHFVSPIGKQGPQFYEYRLVDTQSIEGYRCFQLQYKPKRQGDLAFSGAFWITDSTYALKRITAETDDKVNVNFIDRFKIEQTLRPTDEGPWIPAKTRVLVDATQVSKNTFSLLGKFYISNEDITTAEPKPNKFYNKDITKAAGHQEQPDSFWQQNRHGQLTAMEEKVYNTVDSVRNMPVVKSYTEVIETIVNGYWDLGQVEVGPYLQLYGNNVVEGHRFRIGGRTDEDFSKQWIFSGYLAYGTKDKNFKYNLQAERFLSRESWTKVGFQHKYDLEGLGIYEDFFTSGGLFQFSSQIGLIERFNWIELNRFWVETDLFDGFTQRAYLVTRDYDPEGNYTFAYQRPSDAMQQTSSQFKTTALTLESRYAPKEKVTVSGNQRVRLRSEKAPVVTLRYTRGINGFLGGDFDYHKGGINVHQHLNLGLAGRGRYEVQGKKIFSRLPYPLLNLLPGNETLIKSNNTYNLMDFYEFVADETIGLSYTHHFEGFILNRVPLLKQTDWRLVGGGKAVFGDFNSQNDNYIPTNTNPEVDYDFIKLSPSKPYAEVSYGIENILKVIRIEAIHRLTYLGNSGADPFGVKGSFYFSF